ncbi:MAG: hypothetical protein ACD_58C00292G0006 [uncultured bacterium]|nr:MAG: hypothetical protein ACD_58C00292G0006 [uncultured bacterium]
MTIGIFDSGIGGLGIFDEIRFLMPNEQILYLADTANCPYGEKSEQQIKQICLENSKFLIEKGADIIVVACNTASTVALEFIRFGYNNYANSNLIQLRRLDKVRNNVISIIGVVPVVKTCSEVSKNKRIGILATKRTVESQYLKNLVEKFCPSTPRLRGINSIKRGFKVYYQAANPLVELVEKSQITNDKSQINYNFSNSNFQNLDFNENSMPTGFRPRGRSDSRSRQVINLKFTSKDLKLIEKYLQIFKDNHVDTIALGCTHFPFLRQQIEQIMGPNVKILDSNGAVARQTARIAYSELHIANRQNDSLITLGASKRLAISNKQIYQFYTSGDREILKNQIINLIGLDKNNFIIKKAGRAGFVWTD